LDFIFSGIKLVFMMENEEGGDTMLLHEWAETEDKALAKWQRLRL